VHLLSALLIVVNLSPASPSPKLSPSQPNHVIVADGPEWPMYKVTDGPEWPMYKVTDGPEWPMYKVTDGPEWPM